MKEKIGIAIAIIGLFMTAIGFCSLDTQKHFCGVVIFTICGLALVGIGGLILQIFD